MSVGKSKAKLETNDGHSLCDLHASRKLKVILLGALCVER